MQKIHILKVPRFFFYLVFSMINPEDFNITKNGDIEDIIKRNERE